MPLHATRRRRSACLLACVVFAGAPAKQAAARGGWETPVQAWRAVDGRVYGCVPDAPGPLGGGEGYIRVVAQGQVVATSVEELLAGLQAAQPGQIVYIPGEVTLDFTSRVLADRFQLHIPPGVTLAGDRGLGGSRGALLACDALGGSPLLVVDGPGVRVTGLRIRGPDPGRRMKHWRESFGLLHAEKRDGLTRHEYYYRLPAARGISTEFGALEVDNCELSGWSHSAVFLAAGEGHHIHHNHIHHNQRQGLGYGVSHGAAFSLIEHNLFEWNRHSIAGTGAACSGYVARHNLEAGPSLSHSFDMHGSRSRTQGARTAGARIEIYNNTFLNTGRAVAIRGRPEEYGRIYANWFVRHAAPGVSVIFRWPGARTVEVGSNLYGSDSPTVR